MPDNPHVPETGFILAAERAIKELQDTAEDQRIELDKQQKLLEKAQKDARWRKIQVRALGLVAIILTVVCILGSVQYVRTSEIARKVQQGSISQCVSGNAIRAAEVQVWDSFISLLLQGNKNPKDHAVGMKFEQYIAKVYAPRNCTQLFNISSPGPDSFGAG
jgi:hypothetical protein